MNYQQKYLKYKNKYLELKNQIGGEGEGIHVWIGGSFSPPTIAHFMFAEQTARYIKDKMMTDPADQITIHFVPANDYYTKDSVGCVTINDRMAMLQIGIDKLNSTNSKDNILFKINTFEIDRAKAVVGDEWYEKPISTYYSIQHFQPGANREKVFFLQGEDNVKCILNGSWKYSYDLIFNSNILCLPRNDDPSKSIPELFKAINLKKEDHNNLNEPKHTLEHTGHPDATAEQIIKKITVLPFTPSLISSTQVRNEINKLRESVDPDVLIYILTKPGNPANAKTAGKPMYLGC